jgi:hypothetical protein
MSASFRNLSNFLVVFVLITIQSTTVIAQRFMRDSMSAQMEAENRGEMTLANENLAGMSREMFLLQDLNWELAPPNLDELQDRKLAKHIRKYLNAPLQMKLFRKQGKHGLKAMGITERGTKLRAFWRQGARLNRTPADVLQASYDDAVQARLFSVEFEIVLPSLKRGQTELPSVVYEVAVEPGTMNPKAMIPRGSSHVRVVREGASVNAGMCAVGVAKMRAGLVDSSWARGRAIFRKGRAPGVI